MSLARRLAFAASCALPGALLAAPALAQKAPAHNIILFVPDGLRALKVTPDTAPTMAAVRDKGVNFKNPHSLFPTFTTANASGFATGHYLGDTGDFSNTIYAGYPVHVPDAPSTVTPFLENDVVLGDVDQHFGGNYLDEEAILEIAHKNDVSTAAIGKVGPILIFDHTERSGNETIVVDDATGAKDKSGQPTGIALSDEVKTAMQAAGLPLVAPGRGANGATGSFDKPGTTAANTDQQGYFANVTTKVVLPLFKARNKPFVLVFWSRDPDGSQHNQGDSLNALTPGINGPTSLAAIKNADDNLRQIRQALDDLGLAATTDIIIAADHGFSTISKESKTSPAAKTKYPDVQPGFLPPGFLAVDLAKSLHMPLFHPNTNNAPVPDDGYPKSGNGVIGANPDKPDIVVAANGGSDLVYLPNADKALAARVVSALMEQDYVSGLFVDERLGAIPGTLPLKAINLSGRAVTPHPAIVVNFRSFATDCDTPVLCTAEVADSGLQQGQGMHGSFSRADTMNFMAAVGPDFKAGFADDAPVGNADVGRTIAHILKLRVPSRGNLLGRVMDEAMPGGKMPKVKTGAEQSPQAGPNGLRTVLNYQQVGATRYFDAAGFPGRTVGLTAPPAATH
ncbi:MAG TPA: alkaline phosphatase family protein [Xanthobacteraceae bacterium]|nr:alkaline phosphatase family protein [Xanthobacteraceae bacterium]